VTLHASPSAHANPHAAFPPENFFNSCRFRLLAPARICLAINPTSDLSFRSSFYFSLSLSLSLSLSFSLSFSLSLLFLLRARARTSAGKAASQPERVAGRRVALGERSRDVRMTSQPRSLPLSLSLSLSLSLPLSLSLSLSVAHGILASARLRVDPRFIYSQPDNSFIANDEPSARGAD